MRDVALEVGFTQAAIYYHFFRQDRFLQAWGRPCDQAGDGQHRGRWGAASRDGTPPERLRPIIGRFSSNNDGCILFQRVFIDTDRENALSLAKSAYNREIGRPLDVKARLEEPALPEVLQGGEAALVECAVRKNAAIEGIRHADAALAAQAKAEKDAYLPQVVLTGGWMRQDDPYRARDRGWVVGVTMKWNILDGGVRAANVTEIGKKRAALEHQKAEAGSLVELAVRQCLLNVNEADERLGVAQSALAQADENLRAVRERYRHGLVSHTEVLDAETLRLSSDMNAMYVHYDAVLAGLRLRHAMSEL